MTAQIVIGFGGRALLAMLFILAGLAKILGPQPFLQHMAQYNVPGFLFPAVIVLELGAGIALLCGWQVTFAAAALGIFSLLTAVIFHHALGRACGTNLVLQGSRARRRAYRNGCKCLDGVAAGLARLVRRPAWTWSGTRHTFAFAA